jgi:SAM-dependent methyltransferase
MPDDERVSRWLEALDKRHLADLTPSETARALRALSSCYVERREKLARGGALESAGKRAAFGLFYAPLHFLVTREVVRALPDATNVREILDLGCGTGAAGASWALEANASRIMGIDRHPWAVAEANWTYKQFGIPGRATQGDAVRARFREHGLGIVAAYTVNELSEPARDELLPRLLEAHTRGARLLIVEPIARRLGSWWPAWEKAFTQAGGRVDEWRFPASLPRRQRDLGRAAGLDPRELTARTLWL